MKYITTQDEEGKEEIFIFPRSIHHDAMAEILPILETKLMVDGKEYTGNPYQPVL